MKAPSKNSSIAALVIWTISLILAFQISPQSPFIWIADALLLFGFYPILISLRVFWLWFVFGFINVSIGCILLIYRSAPKEELIRLHITEMNSHMELYHPYYIWVIIGFLSTLISLLFAINALVKWLQKFLSKAK